MDSIPVNWECLDALITDFARSENLIEDLAIPASSSPPSTPCSLLSSSTSYQSRLVNRKIRKLLEAGNVDAAVDLLRSHFPTILDDHRILFRLQKQKFIELLRKGTPEDRSAAIECLRTALAPCALDAYPEAYKEFKHILLAFIYDKDDQTSPVVNEWSEKRRSDIAGFMSSIVRAHLHVYDPIFSMTLRYLISIHKEYCFRQGASSPISDLTERLLLEERDSPATLQESFYEAPPFDEVDIQALAHAVELTRQGAIDSLRVAKGDLFLAFQNEMCRMRLDMPMLDSLVREYCVFRGIVDSGPIVSPEMQVTSKPLKVHQPASNSEGEITSIGKDISMGMPSTDSELRYGNESTSNPEICSTSESHPSCSPGKSRCRKKFDDRGKRKRWRGRSDEFNYLFDVSYDECSKQEVRFGTSSTVSNMSKKSEGSEKNIIFDIIKGEDKYEFVLEIKYLASRGMAAEVVDEINSLDPNFFVQNPVFLFQLKQVQFLNLVNSGDHTSALNVACSHLGPLAAKDPSLLKPLKETLMTLIQHTDEAPQKCLPLDALSTSLQVAVGRRLGIEEPQLMKIMRATLHTHNEWFKLQMCKDRFESLLKIDALKDVNSPMITLAAASLSKSNTDSCTHSSVVTTSSSGRMAEDGSSPTQVSSTDAIYDETAILKVMEFLALPRGEAIHLLAEYDGNAETVIQQLFTEF